jgi:hypothetical protein
VKQFYVYRLADYGGETLYIGKGTGRRLKNQISRTGLYGEIISRHATDAAAYKAEVAYISKFKPSLNKNSGGGGPMLRRVIAKPPKWIREIEEVGSRRFTARALLALDLSSVLDASKIEAIRQVANGPRI